MQNNSILFKNIESLGERYINKCLSAFNKQRLECDWWDALKFFYWHSFMRGRPDELSAQYCEFAISGLRDYFNINELDADADFSRIVSEGNKKYFKDAKEIKRKKNIKGDPEFLKLAEMNPIIKILIEKSRVRKIENQERKNRALGNSGDIVMVLGVLDFITESEFKKNIYLYMRNKLKDEGSVKYLYDELTEIKYIKDKIATFIIRDILLLNPQIDINESNYKYVLPIDTWVTKIADKLECKGETTELTKKKLIDKVKENKLDICKFAAGLWHLGAFSLDVLLDEYLCKFEL